MDLQYLNPAVLDSIDPAAFRTREPFPWVNPQYFIRPERYPELLATLPDIGQFRAFFGKQRKHGQASHDRYVLDFEEGMDLSAPWARLIEELRGDAYRKFVCKMLDVSHVRFRFHWHFTPNGGEVSPHCDNRSLIFGRRGNSWHGVRRINCPDNYFRKVFIVVFEEHRPLRMAAKKMRRLLTGAELVTEKERLMY